MDSPVPIREGGESSTNFPIVAGLRHFHAEACPDPPSGPLPVSPPDCESVPGCLLVHSRPPLGGCRDGGRSDFHENPLYILRMNDSSPLLSLMCGGFLVNSYLSFRICDLLPYIQRGKIQKDPRSSSVEALWRGP